MKPWKSASSASRWILTLGLSTRRCSICLTSAVGSLPLMVSPSSSTWPPSLGERSIRCDLVAHVAERQGAGHAGDAAADDDGGVRERHVDLEQRLEQPGPGHAHLHQFLGLLRGLLRLLGVHPARLVADVGHLEEERVEAGLAQRVLEDGLVRARRAAGDDHAVEVVLLDGLADEREAVATSTCTSCRWRTRRRAACLAYSATLSTSMTPAMLLPQWQTKTPTRGSSPATSFSAGYSLSTVSVWRESARPVITWAAAAEAWATAVGDVLGLAERADDEHALAAGLERVELVQLAEAVAVEGDADVAGRLLRLARRLQAGREHHHVVARLVQLAALVLPADQEVLGERVFLDVRGARADELDALVQRALVEGVEALALGAHVHEEDGRARCRARGRW